MRILALVTARGGSKGFPGKNLALLAGRPLVAWAHRTLAAVRDRHPDVRLHLSTDDPAIAEAWPAADRPARLRPAALAGDASASLDVIRHELAMARQEGFAADAVLLLQPTSPLLGAEAALAAIAAVESGAPSVLAVAPAPHPPAWALAIGGDGAVNPLLAELAARRRQEQPPAFLPCGLWLATARQLDEQAALVVPGRTIAVRVPAAAAVDIDAAHDLATATALLGASRRRRALDLGGRRLGEGLPCCVIAEAGVNHNGSLDLALRLVDAAAAARADVVKFQTFQADHLASAAAPQADYQARNTGRSESQLEMLRRLELHDADFARLKAHAEAQGLVFLSSPFDAGSARRLRDLGVAAFKLGSGELTSHPLLAEIAGWGRPLLLSTGMCDLDEVEAAAAVVRDHGDPPVCWLHCVSCYPAPPQESNLRALDALRLAVDGVVGMSDHAMGHAVALAAVARGAVAVEKHLTLDRALPGPDHAASLTPDELARAVADIRLVESALGDGIKRAMPSELSTRAVARKSVVAARDLPVGHRLALADLAIKRPGGGIPPARCGALAGRVLLHPVAADRPLSWDDLA
jgi:N-acetylneuraminate synthase/N,N'-diacetyllegionaminate synthase